MKRGLIILALVACLLLSASASMAGGTREITIIDKDGNPTEARICEVSYLVCEFQYQRMDVPFSALKEIKMLDQRGLIQLTNKKGKKFEVKLQGFYSCREKERKPHGAGRTIYFTYVNPITEQMQHGRLDARRISRIIFK